MSSDVIILFSQVLLIPRILFVFVCKHKWILFLKVCVYNSDWWYIFHHLVAHTVT